MNSNSDWSVVPMPENPASLWVRLIRRSTAVEVQYSLDAEHYTMLMLAYLIPVKTLSVGLMCASPQGNRFPMKFEEFKVGSL